ncbi:hypothetical protein NDN08_005326 [Rhodosorus marinus]|uniref:Hedgehog protein Hint domain-containing protein n=1 Tax=Rhodosorus marinus TaxID=101924 RepID=A0AAV8V565_9RHOD|nr:hypothetical protein NDN08_005326 [Rhodosorus marinus]
MTKCMVLMLLLGLIVGSRATGELNKKLTVSPVAAWTPVQEIMYPSSGVCVDSVLIKWRLTNEPVQDFDFRYRLYPVTSLHFGAVCTSEDSAYSSAIFYNSFNYADVPGIMDSLSYVLLDDDVGGFVYELMTMKTSITYYFNQEINCSGDVGFSATVNSQDYSPENPVSNPIGFVFTAQEGMMLNGYVFQAGVRYLNYILMDSNGYVERFCSYVDELCFPADAVVELEDGSLKTMPELVVGESVRVGPEDFSEVFFFGHRDGDETAEYVKLHGENDVSVSLSSLHYIYANGVLVSGSHVKLGDVLSLSNGQTSKVIAISKQPMTGAFAPHTLHGDIVVNGVIASSYTRVVHPNLAHKLLAPIRFLYRIGFPSLTFLEKSSRANFVTTMRLPTGPPSFQV